MKKQFSISALTSAFAAACLIGGLSAYAHAEQPSAACGLFKISKDESKDTHILPLPALFSAVTDKNWDNFLVKNMTTNETFKMPVYPHYPVASGVQPVPIQALGDDQLTYIVPVDLMGRGASDIMLARESWSGWQVYTNGARLSKPFDGFVEGMFSKDKEEFTSKTLVADAADLRVDNNLLGAVGDFLGNGTEQLAYFRPGWDQIRIVGAHGKSLMDADLKGIPEDLKGARINFLFAFKGTKPGERTRLAFHRSGWTKLLVFTSDGARFSRSELPTKENWNLLNQTTPNPL